MRITYHTCRLQYCNVVHFLSSDFNPPLPATTTEKELRKTPPVTDSREKEEKPDIPKPVNKPKVDHTPKPVDTRRREDLVGGVAGRESRLKSPMTDEKSKTSKLKKADRPDKQVSKNFKNRSKTDKSSSAVEEVTTKKIELLATETKVCTVQALTVSKPKNQTSVVKQGSTRLARDSSSDKPSRTGSFTEKRLIEKVLEGQQGHVTSRVVEGHHGVKHAEDVSWTKVVSNSSSPQSSHVTSKTNQIRPHGQSSNQIQSSFASKVRQEHVWTSSQESTSDWGSEEMDLEDYQALARCSTDDDKIRKLRDVL